MNERGHRAAVAWLALGLGLAAGCAGAAEVYKWVDERGITHYGESPPPGQAAKPVDVQPRGIVESDVAPGPQREAEPRRSVEPPPAASAPPAGAAVRGMDFDTFIRLQRGMTEGELLIRAGKPDHETIDAFRHEVVKTYYYFPTAANPYTTVVTLRGGRIVHLERVKKF